jgi:large subunit ribosomal protein L7e
LQSKSESGVTSLNPSKAAIQKRKVIFKRAETYVKEYLNAEKEEIRLRRAARAAGDFYVSCPTQALLRYPDQRVRISSPKRDLQELI